MLVSCATGGGNLLLNFGPRPDGTFADGEAAVATATGEWLARNGDALYATRGGPYRNGAWGGSCHKGTRLFLHVYGWPNHGPLIFDPMPRTVLSARIVGGPEIPFSQSPHELSVDVPMEARDPVVTVIELAIDQPIEPGTVFGTARSIAVNLSEYGEVLSEHASLSLSSMSYHDRPEDHFRLFRGPRADQGYAFHTEPDDNPWAIVDLGEVRNVKAVIMENRPGEYRTDGLILSVSEDCKAWREVWRARAWDEKWLAVVTHFHAGIDVPGQRARYLKMETKGEPARPLLLQRVTVLGE